MFDFFTELLNTIISPIKIVVLIFEILFDLITVAYNFLACIYELLPTSWVVVAGILVTVSVLYKIFGRESSG